MKYSLLVAMLGVLAFASTGGADIDLDKQLNYVLNSQAIPAAVLKQAGHGTDISKYSGVNINYNQSLLDKSGLTWKITAKDLPSQMNPDSSVVGSGAVYNCDPNNEVETTTTIDWTVIDTHLVETEVKVDVGTEVSIEGKDEILGTGVDVGLKMTIDFGVAVTEAQKYSKENKLSKDATAKVPPKSKVPVNCSMYSFTFDDKEFTMELELSGQVSLPTLDYAFKNGPSGHLPGFTFNIEDVLSDAERTVSTKAKLSGQQYGVEVDCVVKEAVPLTADDESKQCKN